MVQVTSVWWYFPVEYTLFRGKILVTSQMHGVYVSHSSHTPLLPASGGPPARLLVGASNDESVESAHVTLSPKTQAVGGGGYGVAKVNLRAPGASLHLIKCIIEESMETLKLSTQEIYNTKNMRTFPAWYEPSRAPVVSPSGVTWWLLRGPTIWQHKQKIYCVRDRVADIITATNEISSQYVCQVSTC